MVDGYDDGLQILPAGEQVAIIDGTYQRLCSFQFVLRHRDLALRIKHRLVCLDHVENNLLIDSLRRRGSAIPHHLRAADRLFDPE